MRIVINLSPRGNAVSANIPESLSLPKSLEEPSKLIAFLEDQDPANRKSSSQKFAKEDHHEYFAYREALEASIPGLRKKSKSDRNVSEATASFSHTPTTTSHYNFRQNSDSLLMNKARTPAADTIDNAFGGFGFFARNESAKTPAAKIED
jgi:hypothetical protein